MDQLDGSIVRWVIVEYDQDGWKELYMDEEYNNSCRNY